MEIKKTKKLFDKKCYFCEENRIELLDSHRIQYGCNGGKYNSFNILTVCVLHHRLIHSDKIKIDRKYYSTSGKWVLHYWIEGIEFWN